MGRTPTPDDPGRFTKHDRDIVVAWSLEKLLECPNCGTRQEEWDADLNAYYPKAVHCLGCEKLAYEAEASREGDMRGIRFALVRAEPSSTPKISPLRGGDAPNRQSD